MAQLSINGSNPSTGDKVVVLVHNKLEVVELLEQLIVRNLVRIKVRFSDNEVQELSATQLVSNVTEEAISLLNSL